MPKRIEISHKTIIFAAVFGLGLWFLYSVRDLILALFVAFLLMTILEPIVNAITRIKFPRGLAILFSYLIFFGIFGGAIAMVIPALVDQTANFVAALPNYLSNIGVGQNISQQVVNEFLVQVGSLPGEIIKIIFSLFSNILSVLMVLALTFYMLLARPKLYESLGLYFGEEKKKDLIEAVIALETRLGRWARGEIFLMLLVGTSTYIGLSIIGIPFSLPLAILAGILEIIPNLGPIIAAVPSIIIGLGISPLMGLAVAGLATLVQQIENYVFVPKVMQKSVGVSPLITLLALAVGMRIAGVVGMLISVPTVITIQIILKEYFVKE